MKSKNALDNHLVKYLNNKLSKDEFDEFINGFEDPLVEAKYALFLEGYFEQLLAQKEITDGEKKAELSKEAAMLTGAIAKGNQRYFLRKYSRAIGVAASISLVFISVLMFRLLNYGGELRQVELIEQVTLGGEKSVVELPDGSIVNMNAGSKLTYPKNFSSTHRTVSLEGEAFFDIARDTLKPFHIQTKDMEVKVLGTSFNVSAYPEEDETAVAVKSGKVAVAHQLSEKSHFLVKNQLYVLDKTTGESSVFERSIEQELLWMSGVLTFEHSPFPKVKRMLERWYDVEIYITDNEINSYKLTGTHANENILAVLESFKFALDIDYKIEGRKVILSKNIHDQ
ncbi:FecR domain-containing protein [Flammeovirgaceae bacterium SG7u.111]|nr:FecR domain-containing protein [Flammeovirgaceae bacterium SG7u.132]WPO33245.1 FecR domain-containing protein [Flammeovirgaceae bacterium SG7u.111]